MINRG